MLKLQRNITPKMWCKNKLSATNFNSKLKTKKHQLSGAPGYAEEVCVFLAAPLRIG
jgi:hypothetical protein